MKYYLPLIMTFFSGFMLSGKFMRGRLILICPIMLAAIFLFSLATLEVSGGILRYRRFRKWTPIDPETVVNSGTVWPGLIGYIRLNRPVRPWSRLYFILDEQPGGNPFKRKDSALLAYLRTHTSPGHQGLSKLRTAPLPLSNLLLLIAGLAGATFFFTMRKFLPFLTTPSGLRQPVNNNLASFIVISAERGITFLLNSYPSGIALCAIFLSVAIYRRRRTDAWMYALLAGSTSAAVCAHFL